MTPETIDRLVNFRRALEHPVSLWIVLGVAAALAAAPALIWLASRRLPPDSPRRRELWVRYRSWLILVPLIGVPVLMGALWTMVAVAALCFLCYREFARATGLFRERLTSAAAALGIAALMFAVLDNWYTLYLALAPLTVVIIAAAGVLPDRPRGYLQRVALGALGFLLFGVCLGHLGLMANDPGYRPLVLLVLLAVELNDIFAFTAGRLFGRRKLAPQTSPGKTLEGTLGALALTVLLWMLLAGPLFRGTPLAHPAHLVALGVIVSLGGQLGDLVLSSVKRDLGIKDFGVVIPGHGGLLDRFDSLILVAPAVFHYVQYFVGFSWDPSTRIISGGPP